MLWVVQENLWKEPEYRKFLDIISRSGVNYRTIKVIPFSHELEPKIEYDGRIIAYGSTTLMRISQSEGWNPGCYFNDQFDYTHWKRHLGEYLLNSDATVCRFKDVIPSGPDFFIRPCADLKHFTGRIVKHDEFEEWRENTLNMDSVSTLCGDTLVSYAPVKTIYNEHRFFVVDRKVVTGSMYRLCNEFVGGSKGSHLSVEPAAMEFAQEMVDIWGPHDIFVIDVALTDNGYRVVELNCANAAGFYNSDVSKLVQAIHSYEGVNNAAA